MTNPLIAILTDFGLQDPFVGVMKGVIAGICPSARTIDLTHEIPPGDIRRAAIVLWQTLPYLPPDSVLLVVVDPGVGTARLGIAAQLDRHFFVGPDNGLASFIAGPASRQWRLENHALRLPAASQTFHGRDIFAPAAAHIACGVPLTEFGDELGQRVALPEPRLARTAAHRIEGEALHADHFGNILTSIGQLSSREGRLKLTPWRPGLNGGTFVEAGARLRLPSGERLEIVQTFGSLPHGGLGAVVGSSGLLEIVSNGGRAVDRLKIEPGARLTLEFAIADKGDP